jgi:hypothetical protein
MKFTHQEQIAYYFNLTFYNPVEQMLSKLCIEQPQMSVIV